MSAYARVCRAPREEPDRDKLLRIYRVEPLRRLLKLEHALTMERAAARDNDTIAFCDWRLPLVQQVLAEKQQ